MKDSQAEYDMKFYKNYFERLKRLFPVYHTHMEVKYKSDKKKGKYILTLEFSEPEE